MKNTLHFKHNFHIFTFSYLLIFFSLCLSPGLSRCQTGISINNSGSPADNSAILDVETLHATSPKGLLIPRMTTAQRDAIVSPALSLLIFNTTTYCFESYVNGNWYPVSCAPGFIIPCNGSGNIKTIAGTGVGSYNGDGIIATTAQVSDPRGVAVDDSGNVYIGDAFNNRIRKITFSTGIISTIAGTGGTGYGTGGFSGDNGPAVNAKLNNPTGIALDRSGNIYFADEVNNRIRKITKSTGIITSIAGDGSKSYGGDGGLATAAKLNYPTGVAIDNSGNVFIADFENNRIRKITVSTGIITTIAGNGVQGYSGDGGLATSAKLNFNYGLGLDNLGNVYIADRNNNVIRKVTVSTGIITTIAGTGTAVLLGDGGPATSAQLNMPFGVIADNSGNIYIDDTFNSEIRMINVSDGNISTVAGNGTAGFSGDGGPAINAQLNFPIGIALDKSGNLYISDESNNSPTGRIRSLPLITFNV